ncbi:MAG: FAD-dependent oxidoreductase, partial [Caldilinea sp.]|nr:FAD-dependent oxidoreductase [Caldilinea sp.]
QDVGGRPVTAETRSFDPDAENLARVQAFMRKMLPGALGPILYTKTCLYTLTPDRDFIIDRVPGHPHVALAVGAGHAFKFASVIGRLLAGLAGEESIDTDLTPFAADRAILREENPAANYLV